MAELSSDKSYFLLYPNLRTSANSRIHIRQEKYDYNIEAQHFAQVSIMF